MDLKNLTTTQEGATLELRHPATGEILKYGGKKDQDHTMHLILAGVDSDAYKKAQRKVTDRRFKQQQKFRQIRLTSAMIEDEAIEILTAVTLGGKLFMGGKETAVDANNAGDIYREYPWIKEQVDTFIEDRSNFLSS